MKMGLSKLAILWSGNPVGASISVAPLVWTEFEPAFPGRVEQVPGPAMRGFLDREILAIAVLPTEILAFRDARYSPRGVAGNVSAQIIVIVLEARL